MIEASDIDSNVYDPCLADRERGKISSMKDDFVVSFTTRGVLVERDGDSVIVRDPETGTQLGGAMILDHAHIEEVREWIVRKAQLYGDA